MLQLTGHLVFEPERGPGFKKAGKLKTLILDLPRYYGAALYYKAQIERVLGPWCNLSTPMFGTHVTVVRGNGDRFDEALLRSVIGRPMTVVADPRLLERTPWSGANPGFWTIEVVSPELHDLRKSLKVKEIFTYRPHLTVARENSGFFMHAEAPQDPLEVASQCMRLNSKRKGKQLLGNQQLQRELRDFVHGYRVNPLCTGEELMRLVYRHIAYPNPNKPWELDIVNLFRHAEGLAS